LFYLLICFFEVEPTKQTFKPNLVLCDENRSAKLDNQLIRCCAFKSAFSDSFFPLNSIDYNEQLKVNYFLSYEEVFFLEKNFLFTIFTFETSARKKKKKNGFFSVKVYFYFSQ
jgi:hypothetical protein